MKAKLNYIYLISMRIRLSNGERTLAFYSEEKDGKPVFTVIPGKAKAFNTRKEAKAIGFKGYKSIEIVKIPIGEE